MEMSSNTYSKEKYLLPFPPLGATSIAAASRSFNESDSIYIPSLRRPYTSFLLLQPNVHHMLNYSLLLHPLAQTLQRHDFRSDRRTIFLLDRNANSRQSAQSARSVAQSEILHPPRRHRITLSRDERFSLHPLTERRNSLQTHMYRSRSHFSLIPTPKRPFPPPRAHTPAVRETPAIRRNCCPRDLPSTFPANTT